VNSLYKYVSSEYIRSTLSENTIYCPTPDKLNDPFDSKLYFTKKPAKKIIKEIESYKMPVFAEAQTVIQTINNINIEKHVLFNDLYKKYGDDFEYFVFRDYGLYAMTTDKNSLLMWSHYGEKHKGFCIEWERKEGGIFSNTETCFPINYSSYLPEYDYEHQSEKEVARVKFGNKSDIWTYEKEWRYITKESNKNIQCDAKLMALYIGCKAELEKTKYTEIIDICKHKNIEIFQARMKDREYKIDFIKVE